MLLVVFSTAFFCLETIDVIGENYDGYIEYPNIASALDWADRLVMFLFTLEYILRLITCPHKIKFAVQPMNIIDLLALIPAA